jgi:signal transduction histidine kinase
MSSRKTAKVTFGSAVVLLLLCGVGAMIAISRYSNSAEWVNHTYEVTLALGRVESTLAEAARARLSYITDEDPSYLQLYESAKKNVSEDLLRVQELSRDNPLQQDNFNRLNSLANRRIALLQSSLDSHKSGQPDASLQRSVSLDNTKIADSVRDVIGEMQKQEDVLLAERKNASSRLFAAILWIFGVLLAGAFVLLWIHYRLLNEELGKREGAENGARQLSVRVLELQDEERRKFSRELHDGLGQSLSAAKMVAMSIAGKQPGDRKEAELIELLERSIQETRTISYLLHPPMLDELGIASAASWYLDGFSERSGIQVSAKITDGIGRLPRPAELVLFRVLQESLTNVHRHAKSTKADVALYVADGSAVLHVRDYGTGIPPEKLNNFNSNGAHVGVGLTGMRERVREHGGKFEIHSSETGTTVRVTIPLEDRQTPRPNATVASETA